MLKIEVQKFPTNFVEDHREDNSAKFENVTVSANNRSSILNISLPLGPTLTKSKKKIVKISIFNIPNVLSSQ